MGQETRAWQRSPPQTRPEWWWAWGESGNRRQITHQYDVKDWMSSVAEQHSEAGTAMEPSRRSLGAGRAGRAGALDAQESRAGTMGPATPRSRPAETQTVGALRVPHDLWHFCLGLDSLEPTAPGSDRQSSSSRCRCPQPSLVAPVPSAHAHRSQAHPHTPPSSVPLHPCHCHMPRPHASIFG